MIAIKTGAGQVPLSDDFLAGLSEFRIPHEFGQRLFDYQAAAVKIAAHHLNKRGSVLVGDVVGLGKTAGGLILWETGSIGLGYLELAAAKPFSFCYVTSHHLH